MKVNSLLANLASHISDRAFIIDSNANIQANVSLILLIKTGVIQNLTYIQSIIVADEVYELVKQELMCYNAYFLSHREKQLLKKLIYKESFDSNDSETKISVEQIAQLVGIKLQRELYGCDSYIYCPLPSSYELLIVEIEIGESEKFTHNISTNYPILIMHKNN